MQLLHRNRDDVTETYDEDYDRDYDREVVEEPPRRERVDVVERRWSIGTVLVALAGAALAVLGIVALTRTEINETWYRPIEQVADIDHTPLLAAVEVGVGALLVLLGLAGARFMSALVCLATAVAAGVVAVDPGEFQRELAIERWWAITLAAAAAVLTLVALMPSSRGVERRYDHPERAPRRYRRAVPQH